MTSDDIGRYAGHFAFQSKYKLQNQDTNTSSCISCQDKMTSSLSRLLQEEGLSRIDP